MTDLIEELRKRPAEERLFSLDGIKFIGMGKSLEHRSADEIERLREALDLAHKMRPLPEYRDDPRLQEVIEEQRAEIERLREELAWCQENWPG
jgi:hypothetical protein